MNYTNLFYWISVADGAKKIFLAMSIILLIVSIVSIVIRYLDGGSIDLKVNSKWITTSIILLFISSFSWVFIPDKKDSLLIIAGGSTLDFLTKDSSASKIPSELSNYLLKEIKNQTTKIDSLKN